MVVDRQCAADTITMALSRSSSSLEDMIEKGELVLDHQPLVRRKSLSATSTDSSDAAVDNIASIADLYSLLSQPDYPSDVIRSVILTDRHRLFGGGLLKALPALLPGLERLRVYAYERTLSAATVAAFITSASTSLTTFHITSGICIQCQEDIDVLARAFANSPLLKEVSLLDLGSQDDTASNDVLLNKARTLRIDRLLRSLSTLAQLESLDVTLSSRLESRILRVDNDAVSSLFQPLATPSLADISLWHCELDSQHLQHICEALCHHPRIKFLSLRSNPRIRDWKPMADMLMINNVLQSVYYSQESEYDERILNQLRWNQLGLGDMLRDEFCEDNNWMELVEQATSPDSLFCLLQSNPIGILGP